jgi:glycosyltransferase involved in cell wall biosynthesis
MTLSVAIITKNEGHNIDLCLKSVSFADEVIVLDSNSTDDTAQIARKYGAKVFLSSDWKGFGAEKNKALGLCSGDWVLSLDADERIPESLKEEIQTAIKRVDVVAFEIPRLSWYCGRFMNHSGWHPDYVTRLFRKGQARFSDHLVHEKLICGRPIMRLRNSIIHLSFPNFECVLEKMNNYSSASARQMRLEGKTASLFTALIHSSWTFLRTYFLRLGFLDGRHGLVLAISNAHGTYYRYLKLWFLSHNHAFELKKDDDKK